MAQGADEMSFWQHLDVLRGSIIRCIVAVMGFGIAAFCMKEPLFRMIFWPTKEAFPLWQIWPLTDAETHIELINTQLAQQFIVHVEVALIIGAFCVVPYLIYELIRFIGPALYPHEKRATYPAVAGGYVMFVMGVMLSYFVIFPLTYRFLSTYQVAGEVSNLIALDSYVQTLLLMSAIMGIIFELPILCGILARLGLLKAAPMRRCRKHAIVGILVLAAVITPTGDAFTLSIVSLPIYLLYEVSILIVRLRERKMAAK